MLKDPYFYTHVIISVVFISGFISIFFFTYATKVERNIVENQTKSLVNSLTGNISYLVSDNTEIKEIVNNLSIKDSKDADERVKDKNKKILKEAVLVVGISSLCLILIVIILIIKYKINWKKLLITNIIILIVIGIVEFSFLTFIAQNYKSFDPNYVKYQIIENLEKIKESN